MCTSTHFFLGANSGRGFQSLFDRFCEPADFDDLLVLKGSAGCGKSTMMRRIGEAMEERGEEVEYLHCSGDPDSLDGVHIPRLRTAVVDGTSPHVVEPKYPAAVERYVNLGAYWDLAGIKGEREAVTQWSEACSAAYRRAYRALGAARQMEDSAAALAAELCAGAGLAADAPDALVITGNTAMLYLLTGADPDCLAHAPFEADRLFGETLTGADLGLCCPGAAVYLPRCISAFVGADTATALLAAGLTEQPGVHLLADIGTNGEIALWDGHTLSCCSTAAGPKATKQARSRVFSSGSGPEQVTAAVSSSLQASCSAVRGAGSLRT